MSRPAGPDTVARPATGSGRGFWVALGLVVLLLSLAVVLLAWYLNRGPAQDDTPPTVARPDTTTAALARGAVLIFPTVTGDGHVTEQRQLPAGLLPEQEVAAVLDSLAAGPHRSDALAPLPRDCRVRAVFRDPEGVTLVIDWSGDLVAGLTGGSSWERAALSAILRTVALNFPAARRCLLLVDGAPVATLAGHLALDRPFDLAVWR